MNSRTDKVMEKAIPRAESRTPDPPARKQYKYVLIGRRKKTRPFTRRYLRKR